LFDVIWYVKANDEFLTIKIQARLAKVAFRRRKIRDGYIKGRLRRMCAQGLIRWSWRM